MGIFYRIQDRKLHQALVTTAPIPHFPQMLPVPPINRKKDGPNRTVLFGTPEGIRIPDLPLRRRTLYPAELLGRICVGKSAIYRTVADATDAQQMAKCLATLGCHLHAACGRCILLSYWGIAPVFYRKKRGMSRKRWGNGYFFNFPLYRLRCFGYNKSNYANFTK